MMTNATSTTLGEETESVHSEASAAIVSLYNSWSATTSECAGSVSGQQGLEDDDGLLWRPDDRFADLPETSLSAEELLQQLKKRCRPEDLPPPPFLRPQHLTTPLCQFINFMGQRSSSSSSCLSSSRDRARPPPPVEEVPSSSFPVFLTVEWDLGQLGLEEKDDLYPLSAVMGSSKVTHMLDGGEEDDSDTKKRRRWDPIDPPSVVISSSSSRKKACL